MKPLLHLYKLHKEPTKKQNFRLQANISHEYWLKILNKFLPNWIQEHIKMIIHHDQVPFILLMQKCLNIWKFINAIHYTNKLKGKYLTISLDAEKDFEKKIQHPFMIKVMKFKVHTFFSQGYYSFTKPMNKKQVGEESVYWAYDSILLFISKGSQDWNSSGSGSKN